MKFKSYYVVWKLQVKTNVANRLKFKSYYVVWKLFFLISIICFVSMFKSYYVVWKQNPNCLPLFHRFSLNRTM